MFELPHFWKWAGVSAEDLGNSLLQPEGTDEAQTSRSLGSGVFCCSGTVLPHLRKEDHILERLIRFFIYLFLILKPQGIRSLGLGDMWDHGSVDWELEWCWREALRFGHMDFTQIRAEVQVKWSESHPSLGIEDTKFASLFGCRSSI